VIVDVLTSVGDKFAPGADSVREARAAWQSLLYPSLPGWGARILLAVWLVGDRAINSERISEEVIRSVVTLDDYAVFQIAMTTVIGVYVSLMLLNPKVRVVWRILIVTPFIWIVLYVALAFISSLWSSVPLVTAFKSVQCGAFLLAAIIAIVGLGRLDLRIRFIVLLAFYYLCVSYVTYAVVTVPELGFNVVTLHFIVGTVPFLGSVHLARLVESRAFTKRFMIVFLPFIVIETILTAYVALLMAELFRFFLRARRLTRYLGLVIPALGVLILVSALPDDPDAKLLGLKSMGEVVAGTGRFEVWNYALNIAFPQAPIFGLGFVVGDAVGRDAGINVAIGQMHNSHLSALLNLGLVGFCLWVFFMLGIYFMIAQYPRREVRIAFAGTALVYAFQQMFGGGSLSSMMHSVWVSHALFFALVAVESLEVRESPGAVRRAAKR